MYKGILILLLSAVFASAQVGTPYPIKASANGRYLTDSNSVPWLMVGDAAWGMLVDLNTADTSAFLFSRRTNGFNAVLSSLVCVAYTGGRADASTIGGIVPFTNSANGQFDLASINLTYFSGVSNVINMAATNGIVMFLAPLETGGFLQCGLTNGAAKCLTYGQFVGNYFKTFTNIVWFNGNDYHVDDSKIAQMDGCFTNVATGIHQNAPGQPQCVEVELASTPATPYVADGMENSNWYPLIFMSLAYTYNPTYDAIVHEYKRANFIPEIFGEGHYEGETLGGPAQAGFNTELGTAKVCRRQIWWTSTSGGVGQLYGNGTVWPFSTGWQAQLYSQGVKEITYWTGFMTNRAWYNLIPDTNNVLVTSGFGVYATASSLVSTNTYATAAFTGDGNMAIVYTPTNNNMTVAMSRMIGPLVKAQWFDPSANTFSTVSGSPFANAGTHNFQPTGNNAAGDGDWVLLLESQSTTFTNVFVNARLVNFAD